MSQYYMNWFKFPKSVCIDTNKISRDFFWNNNSDYVTSNSHKLYTLTWDKICRPKSEDGLNIRTEDINSAFLAKEGWKILTQADNNWVRIVTAKHLNNNKDNFLTSKKRYKVSRLGKIFWITEFLSKKVFGGLLVMWGNLLLEKYLAYWFTNYWFFLPE